MKKIVIVGTGMGPCSITREGLQALEEAEVWFGASRLLETFKPLFAGKEKPVCPMYKPDAILRAVEEREETCFAVLVSGDTGFFSAAGAIREALQQYEPRLIPGVSSGSAFFARLGLPWQDAALLSTHGRDMTAAAGAVRRNRYTFCLTGNNAAALGSLLCETGFAGLTVHAGENLGSPEERIRTITVEELSGLDMPPLSVMLIVNPEPDDRIRFGISDTAFVRGEAIPMTKSEVRALSLAKLALRPGDTCWDIGAGTGSVTVEMALAAWRGRVYAVERQSAAIDLINENSRRFHLGNVIPIAGEAPDVLAELPPPDAVFIGGSGGRIQEILPLVLTKNAGARIVVTAITLETAAAVLALLPQAEKTQLSAARAKKAGDSHLLLAQNPVMILSAGGEA